jgi:hypothetical protein
MTRATAVALETLQTLSAARDALFAYVMPGGAVASLLRCMFLGRG